MYGREIALLNTLANNVGVYDSCSPQSGNVVAACWFINDNNNTEYEPFYAEYRCERQQENNSIQSRFNFQRALPVL